MKQAATHLTTALWVVLWTAVFLAASLVFAATPRPVLVHPVDQEVLPMDIPPFRMAALFRDPPGCRGMWNCCFDPQRPGRIFIGSEHGLYRTTHGGKT
jgi:hypothetical protein